MSLGADLVSALASGLLASLHCAAMCGPLAVAGCSRGASLDRRATAGYLGARFLGYATVGAVVGSLGRHALCILPMSAFQGLALGAVAAGALLRGVRLLRAPAAAPLLQLKKPRSSASGLVAALLSFLPRRGAALGAATALLPCGMLAAAWLLAASTASPLSGAAVMLVFALASAPGLVAALLGRAALGRALARLPRAATGIAWCALAAFLAIRPLFVAAHCAR